ncbi:hypothetical protein Tco_0586777 [Tanacetum coccineum]
MNLCGLTWSKIGKFEKGDYNSLVAQGSNPMFCIAPTDVDVVSPHAVEEVVAVKIEHEPMLLCAIAHVVQDEVKLDANIHCGDVVEEQVEPDPKFDKEDLFAEVHAMKTKVDLIKKRGGDVHRSFLDKELDDVRIRILVVEKFLNITNEDNSKESVAKQFLH